MRVERRWPVAVARSPTPVDLVFDNANLPTSVKGTIEALRYIQSHKKESIDILASYSRSDLGTAAGMFDSYFPAYSRDGTMTNEALQAAIEEALTRAKLEKLIPISQVADRTLLTEAQRELGLK